LHFPALNLPPLLLRAYSNRTMPDYPYLPPKYELYNYTLLLVYEPL